LNYLEKIIPKDKNVIIAGDFNTMRGSGELTHFMKKCRLSSANLENHPTYPVWSPQKELDYILYSEKIKIKDFQIPEVKYSDHYPLLIEFTTA
jgi:endonuclease/exonuclease/phosphatase family metal-dependent hydrolase